MIDRDNVVVICYQSIIIGAYIYCRLFFLLIKNDSKVKAEFVRVISQDEFGFFYLCCFSTIVDKFMWLEYIARYP